ncbi:hypothetical protein CO110_07670 [Candidatus Desantisbacteria bacterium CG_4_9_14_3_um_filter_40_11]|uniref:Uncharacterized protein n=2 Tax=unclassified Candidatus Desantisiibacteriota TaxID=3106372 RepID=A0A2M7JCF7_9BACT|nr:MAG: hypothetical protein COZ71_05235 [Candidatus Desantisbacteria bacterium CG_4_8_14_3_um_filter_40_12]PJB29093.1 MAG: hypothetical protein CO110_07670 [Candidatus Desantisbacteria bacterium CG_4_9_14_3_um_filter_40_11]
MKILVLIGRAGIGGHVISTLTIASALLAKHKVVLAAGKGKLSDEIEKRGIKYIEIPFFIEAFNQEYAYFSFFSWITIKRVMEIVKKEEINIIHAFDAPASFVANFVTVFTGIPTVTTICGGPGPVYPLPIFQKLIVFSKEYKKVMIDKFKWDKKDVVIIKNRINFKEEVKNEVGQTCNFPFIPQHKNIMMVTRFSGEKIKAIEYVFKAVEGILNLRSDITLILIGNGQFYEKINILTKEINNKIGRKGIILTGDVINANLLLKYGDIVIGVGRSAFEGMFWGKPTIIVGENGFAGVIEEKTVEELEYYNFSGRNVDVSVDCKELEKVIWKILEDEQYALKIGRFGREYLEQEIDVVQGIEKIEKIYENILSMEKVSLKVRIKSFSFLIWNVIRILVDYIIFSMMIGKILAKIKGKIVTTQLLLFWTYLLLLFCHSELL